MGLGLHVPEHAHHPVGQGPGYIPPLPEVQVPAKAFGDGYLVGFHELDQGAVGIFHISKMPGGLTHVKGFACGMYVRIHRKGKTFGCALFLQELHIQHIETEVDKAQVAPDPVLEDLFGFAVQGLDQLNFAGPEYPGEGSCRSASP